MVEGFAPVHPEYPVIPVLKISDGRKNYHGNRLATGFK